jgi:hypothetical protein
MTPRATVYTAEIAERILTGLKSGRSLRAVCKDEGMPSQSTARRWVLEDREGFAVRYKEALEIGNPGMRSYTSVRRDRGTYSGRTAARPWAQHHLR